MLRFLICNEVLKINIIGYIALLYCLLYVRIPCVKLQNDVFPILYSIIAMGKFRLRPTLMLNDDSVALSKSSNILAPALKCLVSVSSITKFYSKALQTMKHKAKSDLILGSIRND